VSIAASARFISSSTHSLARLKRRGRTRRRWPSLGSTRTKCSRWVGALWRGAGGLGRRDHGMLFTSITDVGASFALIGLCHGRARLLRQRVGAFAAAHRRPGSSRRVLRLRWKSVGIYAVYCWWSSSGKEETLSRPRPPDDRPRALREPAPEDTLSSGMFFWGFDLDDTACPTQRPPPPI